MSLSSAMSNAMSGLAAASKSTSVISDNIANALTEGYSARSLNQTASSNGGVQVGSVVRNIDPALQKSARSAEAAYGAADVTADFYSKLIDEVGSVNDQFSIAQRLTDFESSLIEATSMPDSTARLNDVAMQAEELTVAIKGAADGLSTLRNAAEESIASEIENLEQNLTDIDELNSKILAARLTGQDTAGLEDQRDNLIDAVNKSIPVQIFDRGSDQIALYTTSGVKLLDGTVAEFSFDETQLVTPYMTVANGQLSGLEIDGQTIDTSLDGKIGGGTLAAYFNVRDVASVEAQEDLDAMASDLIERFQDPTVDTTLGATDVGIFTDGGAFYTSANEMGIANRLEINSVISIGGQAETWRLRDGLNATAQGDQGDTTILNNYLSALSDTNTLASPGLGTGDYSAYDVAKNLMNNFTQENSWAEQELSYTSTMHTELQSREAEMGVDTDEQLQKLIMIETIYGANAHILQAIDEMMQELMRL